MSLSTYSDASIPSLNGWTASAGFPSAVMSPVGAFVGLCLMGLLVLGVLWLKGWYPNSGFRRKRSGEKSTELSSTYDHVTGLPTGRLFVTLLEQSIGRAAKIGRPVALLVVELEHFRMVAESQGHANGNILVRVQAARVKGVLRSTETVARLAQDQLAMILDNLTSIQDVSAIVEKLQATVGLPLTLDGHELFLTCRIGVALYPYDATEQEGLIRQAIQAVKTAKSEGQAVQFASPIVAVPSSEPVSVLSSFTARRP
jgi:diguanylate cyclase (GGDEF)-like protein